MTRCAVVLVIDGLRPDFLGAYGNTWLDTPAFNQLASESALFEFAITDSTAKETVCRSYWQGVHAVARADGDGSSLLARLRSAGIASSLLTDSPEIAAHPLTAEFDECVMVPPDEVREAAPDVERTAIARLIHAAMELIASAAMPEGDDRQGADDSEPRISKLLWIHARGMFGPWDAPTAMRHQFADDEDPLPADFVEPPERHFTSSPDPDELLPLTHAYAGQITVVDACLGLWLDWLATLAVGRQPLLLVTSPRGYPLGEHGRVGLCDQALHGELLRVPLLVRCPDRQHAACRSLALAQPADLFATLLAWFRVPLPENGWSQDLLAMMTQEPAPERSLAGAISPAGVALRTLSWYWYCGAASPAASSDSAHPPPDTVEPSQLVGQHEELYVKPDDRWEVNDIGTRCQAILVELRNTWDGFRRAAESSQRNELPTLDPPLFEPPL